jgi:hypothetical protein
LRGWIYFITHLDGAAAGKSHHKGGDDDNSTTGTTAQRPTSTHQGQLRTIRSKITATRLKAKRRSRSASSSLPARTLEGEGEGLGADGTLRFSRGFREKQERGTPATPLS